MVNLDFFKWLRDEYGMVLHASVLLPICMYSVLRHAAAQLSIKGQLKSP
jgi:hypothetical protein